MLQSGAGLGQVCSLHSRMVYATSTYRFEEIDSEFNSEMVKVIAKLDNFTIRRVVY